MKNSFLYTVIFTFVLCFLFVLILSFTNEATKEIIAANKRFETNKAILETLGLPATTIQEVDQNFSKVQQEEINDHTYYITDASPSGTSYATKYAGPGLWGTIHGYIAVSEDLSTIVGFSVTEQNETPGLGARISESWFLSQLRGEKIANNNVKVNPGGSSGQNGDTNLDNGEIDGVTGATRTSDGIQAILTKSIAQFNKDLGN